MAIKNVFGRGIGFASGVISWVVTRGFGAYGGAAPPAAPVALTGHVAIHPRFTGRVTIYPKGEEESS